MKPSILAGLAVGLATGGWMFAEYALGLHAEPAGAGRWTGFLALLFPVLGARWLVARTPLRGWGHAGREGALFGLAGGVVGGAAIYVYFAVVNPGFRGAGGQPVSAGAQALAGGLGALALGTVLTLAWHALGRRRGGGR